MKKKPIVIKTVLLLVVFHVAFISTSIASSNKEAKLSYEHFFDAKTHWCETMVINCSDFRFAAASQELINDLLGFKGDYDYFAIPGSIRNMLDSNTRKLVLDTFGISVRLHHVKRVVLILHEDCMGYGGSKSFDNRTEEHDSIVKDLKKARRLMRFRFNHLKVYLFYGKVHYKNNERVYSFEQIL
ncbi:MAG: hypothetical protein MRJ65_03685 [Candidatus Brocadiaceae bacterium]|nr:hypothetical protein [Candidatus Brocadiaceae bacterium]